MKTCIQNDCFGLDVLKFAVLASLHPKIAVTVGLWYCPSHPVALSKGIGCNSAPYECTAATGGTVQPFIYLTRILYSHSFRVAVLLTVAEMIACTVWHVLSVVCQIAWSINKRKGFVSVPCQQLSNMPTNLNLFPYIGS